MLQMARLRYPADRWALAVLGGVTLAPAIAWQIGDDRWLLQALAVFALCGLTYIVGCIQHNQAHIPMWTSHAANTVTDWWLTVLRGDGPWSWVETHVRNHHHYANHIGDDTLTWRFGEENNIREVVLYTLWGLQAYVRRCLAHLFQLARRNRTKRLLRILVGHALHLGVLAILVQISGVKTILYVVLPQLCGILTMISTGFFQHHLTDEDDPINSGRNFVGPITNFFHFNHGFHTVHHLDSSLHWTEWPAAHRRIEARMDESLKVKNLYRYVFETVVLGNFLPSRKTRALRQHDIPEAREEKILLESDQ